MTTLSIYPDNDPGAGELLADFDQIKAALAGIGVEIERWAADRMLDARADQAEVLAAYNESIEQLNQRFGFTTVDVVTLNPDHPDRAAMRQKFLAEHTHADFEVRFFVEGSGLFYLHVDGRVYTLLCEKGDLISVPADTTHWFDMGAEPYLKCIRFFTSEDGWVADFTGSDIAKTFPDFDEYKAGLN